MRKHVRRLVSFFVLLLSITSTSYAMTNVNGQPSSIQSYTGKGKWLIVQAWSSTCSICNKAMPGLEKASRSFPNAQVIGVSLDGNTSTAQKFINKHHVSFPTLVSNNNEFSDYLVKVAGEKLRGTPTYLIFDPQGNLKAMQPGDVPTATLKNFLRKQQ